MINSCKIFVESWDPYSTLRGSGQKAELIGKLASRLTSLSIRELRRVRSRLLRVVCIVKCGFCDEIIECREVKDSVVFIEKSATHVIETMFELFIE